VYGYAAVKCPLQEHFVSALLFLLLHRGHRFYRRRFHNTLFPQCDFRAGHFSAYACRWLGLSVFRRRNKRLEIVSAVPRIISSSLNLLGR